MKETINISLPTVFKRKLDKISKREHLNRSDIICEALRAYFVRREFQRLRSTLAPEAEKRGIYTDDDVFRQVS